MEKTSKILQVLLFLLIGNIGIQIAFAQTSAIWDGTYNIAWYNASQSEFTITTAEQLYGLVYLVYNGNDFNGKTIKLGSNIILNDPNASGTRKWMSIGGVGNNSVGFNGTFDGRNFSVSYVVMNGSDILGLFGIVGTSGTIKNLFVQNSYIKKNGQIVGGLASYNLGVISNCGFAGIVEGTDNVGGLIGINAGTISGISVGEVTGTGNNVGGLVGQNLEGEITNSHSTSTVKGAELVGGLIGANIRGIISDSYSTGAVTGTNNVGGFIGANSGGIISDSYSTGAVTGTDYVGGLMGGNWEGEINNSYSNSTVKGTNNVGGLIGINSDGGTINGSKNNSAGSVTGTEVVGGLVGRNYGSDVSNSYSNNIVNGTNWIGGLVGVNENGGTINGSHSASTVTGTGNSVGGLVGSNQESTIIGSYSTGKATGTGRSAGGLVGTNIKGTINESYSTGAVSGTDDVGGLVGWISGDISIINGCNSASTVNGKKHIGGLVGTNDRGTIKDSHSTGTVSGTDDVGGLVGRNDEGIIKGSNSTGAITGTSWVGGLVGVNLKGEIGNSYSNSTVTGTGNNVGGLVGINQEGTVNGSNSNFIGTVTGTKYVGGLVGVNDNGTINGCSNKSTGTVLGTEAVGGLVGMNYDGNISNSYSISKVSGTNYAGGFVGISRGIINGSYSTGTVTGENKIGGFVGYNAENGKINNNYSSGIVNGKNSVGGFVGINRGGEISLNHSTGTVTGGEDFVGGFAGINIGMMERNYSTSAVTGKSDVGGLVGNNSGTVNNSYSTGKVKCGSLLSIAYSCGGLVGDNFGGKIFDSYSVGEVIDGGIPQDFLDEWIRDVGGFVGKNSDLPYDKIGEALGKYFLDEYTFGFGGEIGVWLGNKFGESIGGIGKISGCYYDSLKSKQENGIGSSGTGVYGRTTSQMQTKNNYAYWDFNVIWGINSTSYPHLLQNGVIGGGNSSSSANSNNSSNSNTPSSSSMASYYIFAYRGKDAENRPTTYGGYVVAYVYNDATASNPQDEYSDGIRGFSDGVAKLWNVTLATPDKYSGAGINIDNRTFGSPNIANCEKISYYYKGDPHWFLLEFQKNLCANPDLADDNKWGLEVTPAQSTWTKNTVDLTKLKLARSWQGAGCGGTTGNLNAVRVDLTKVTNISWVFDDNVNSGTSKNLMIANVACLTVGGSTIADNPPPNDITIASGWSSSSVISSSSSDAGMPSSSSNNGTPVRLHQIATSNQATQIRNGINLQTTSKAAVEIFNLKGSSIRKQNFNGGVYTVSLGNLPKGIYVIRVSFGNEKHILRVPVH